MSTHVITTNPMSNMQPIRYGHRLLGLYRILLSTLLFGLYHSKFNVIIGYKIPEIFVYSLVIYAFTSVVSLVLVSYTNIYQTSFSKLILCIDILFALIVIHTSGGLTSDLNIILLVIIASTAVLVNIAFCYFITLVTTVGIFIQEYIGDMHQFFSPDYVQGLTFTLALFATAGLSILMSKRASASEKLAEQRSIDIQNLTTLNEYIIDQMQNGIIVIDAQSRVVLHNSAAQSMLNQQKSMLNHNIRDISEALYIRFHIWREDQQRPTRIKEPGSPLELQPLFTSLGNNHNSGTLISIEDSSAYTEEFQSIKQASLGRLAGSIAHEIRNPLSAIQHAAQLMQEDPHLDATNTRMLDIIITHANRVNRIIENVMQLSRKEHAIPENINLHAWFEVITNDYLNQYNISKNHLHTDISLNSDVVTDSSQLYQIIWNILSNSAKYGTDKDNQLYIYIHGYKQNDTFILEICDGGSGISQQAHTHIFEPFYSSSNSSSGLGLYIVRELCEMNNIVIEYLYDKYGTQGKPYFKLTFHTINSH